MKTAYGLGLYGGPLLFGATPDERATELVRELHEISSQIYQAKNAMPPDVEAVARLLPRWQNVANEYRSLGAYDLSAIDRAILGTANWLQAAGRAVADTAGSVADVASKRLLIGLGLGVAGLGIVAYLATRAR